VGVTLFTNHVRGKRHARAFLSEQAALQITESKYLRLHRAVITQNVRHAELERGRRRPFVLEAGMCAIVGAATQRRTESGRQ